MAQAGTDWRFPEAMIELFDDDEKSEFYYLPDRTDGKYLIL